MIVFCSALIGIIWGGVSAKRRGGNRKDIAQYAFGYGMACTLAGLVITLIILRNFL